MSKSVIVAAVRVLSMVGFINILIWYCYSVQSRINVKMRKLTRIKFSIFLSISYDFCLISKTLPSFQSEHLHRNRLLSYLSSLVDCWHVSLGWGF